MSKKQEKFVKIIIEEEGFRIETSNVCLYEAIAAMVYAANNAHSGLDNLKLNGKKL